MYVLQNKLLKGPNSLPQNSNIILQKRNCSLLLASNTQLVNSLTEEGKNKIKQKMGQMLSVRWLQQIPYSSRSKSRYLKMKRLHPNYLKIQSLTASMTANINHLQSNQVDFINNQKVWISNLSSDKFSGYTPK